MRAAAMTVWVFINLLCFGMCGYLYLIWSQYWMYIEKQRLFSKTPGTPQRNSIVGLNLEAKFSYNNAFNTSTLTADSVRKRSAVGGFWRNEEVDQSVDKSSDSQRPSVNVVRKSHGSPRFPNIHKPILEFDSEKYLCDDFTTAECDGRTKEFKELLLKEFHRVLMGESKVFRSGLDVHNTYDVKYERSHGKEMSRLEALCALKNVGVRTVGPQDEPFSSLGFQIPLSPLQPDRAFNTCAVVTSAGALLGSRLGEFIGAASPGAFACNVTTDSSITSVKAENRALRYNAHLVMIHARIESDDTRMLVSQGDSHDMVLRFNNAPTENYTEDVGSKTTFRVLNSQVVTKPEFNFLEDPLYNNVSIIIWDPANYSSTLQQWYDHPDFPLFSVYKKFLEERKGVDAHLLMPKVLWDLWAVLQDSSAYRLRRNPPSSGFIGVWFAMHRCRRVRVFEYVPSARATRRCHYHATRDDAECTLGAWHPLAQEKALAERLRDNSDMEVFQRGFIDIPGLSTVACD